MTEQPDNLPVYDASGHLICWRPNFDKPGVAERVARECFAAELDANPPRSSLGLRLQYARMARFEREMAERYPKQVPHGQV